MKLENVFPIKQNDTLPALVIKVQSRCRLGEIVPFNLSGVTATTFSMQDDCGNLTISSSPAQITCSSGGTIQYNWVEGDTTESGRFIGEFELLFADGKKLTVPTMENIQIQVMKNINGS